MRCLRCDDCETPSENHAYCIHCTFAVRSEIEDGLRALNDWRANDPQAQKTAAWAEYDREHPTRPSAA